MFQLKTTIVATVLSLIACSTAMGGDARIGDLMLYEITPLDTPMVLDHYMLIDSLPAPEPGSLP